MGNSKVSKNVLLCQSILLEDMKRQCQRCKSISIQRSYMLWEIDMQLNKNIVISNTSTSNICRFCLRYTWRNSFVNNYHKDVQEKMCSTTKIYF